MQYRPRTQSFLPLQNLTTVSHKPTVLRHLAVVFCCILIIGVLASLPVVARAQEPVPSQMASVQDPELTGDGTVRGKLLSGTKGFDIEEGMNVTLDAFIDFQPAAIYSTTVSADGGFEFTDLALDSGGENPSLVYIVSAIMDDIRYTSPILTLTKDEPSVDTTVTAYGVTEDDSGLNLNRVHWIVDSQPGALIVLQMLEVSNLADRTYIGSKVDGLEAPVTVAFHVPSDAVELSFENGRLGERFLQIGNLVYDTTPVLPGKSTRQIVMQYAVPYEGDKAALEQAFEYPVNMVNLRITDLPGMDVAVDDLESLGTVLAAVTVWSWKQGIIGRTSETSERQSQREDLMQRMARLDDKHALGDINDSDWRKQRTVLKNQLMELNIDTADEGATHAEA